jgi:hypothetical protein
MSDSNVRSDAVDVEQIMRQIRARVREKHGSAYTDAELHQLAAARLDALLDPRGNRSALVAEFRRRSTAGSVTDFSEAALYESHSGFIKSLRKLLTPILKLFINPSAFSRAMQARHEIDGLIYEVVQDLVVDNTRLSLEVQNLKMRLESLSTRMDFDVRRAKALENVPPSRPIQQDRPRHQGHQGRPGGFREPSQAPQTPQAPQSAVPPQVHVAAPAQAPTPQGQQSQSVSGGGDGQVGGGDSRRRRRRRRRRRGQGPHGQGQGPQGAQGPQGPQGSQGPGQQASAQPQGAMESHGAADDGGDWDEGDEGASDQ